MMAELTVNEKREMACVAFVMYYGGHLEVNEYKNVFYADCKGNILGKYSGQILILETQEEFFVVENDNGGEAWIPCKDLKLRDILLDVSKEEDGWIFKLKPLYWE